MKGPICSLSYAFPIHVLLFRWSLKQSNEERARIENILHNELLIIERKRRKHSLCSSFKAFSFNFKWKESPNSKKFMRNHFYTFKCYFDEKRFHFHSRDDARLLMTED